MTGTISDKSIHPSAPPASLPSAPGLPLDRARDFAQRGWGLLDSVLERGQRKCQRVVSHAAAALRGGPEEVLCGAAECLPLTPEQMILGYSQGLFPMDQQGEIRWHCPSPRAVLRLDQLRVSANVRRDIRKGGFEVSFDRDFEGVLAGCADRPWTWLTPRLQGLYRQLHQLGVAHSIEVWRGGELVGGSFGMAIGQVFTGETLFHRVDNASKAAVVALAERLRERGFACIDGQQLSAHFARYGATEIPLREYRGILALGLIHPASF